MKNLRNRIILSCAAFSLASFAIMANADEHHWDSCKDQANKDQCVHAQMDKFRAEHEQKLHDALKITAAQEPAWKALTDNFHQQMDAARADHEKMPSNADMEKLSAPDRLQNHLAMMQKKMTMMQNHLTALKSFYAVLTPDQQAIMNKEIARMMRHRHHRWHHHDWHHDDTPPAQAPAKP